MTPPAPSNPASLAAEKELRELRDRFAMRALPFCLMLAAKSITTLADHEQHAFEAAEHAWLIADAAMRAR